MKNIVDKYFHVITGVVIFIIYLFTMAPTVVQIDSGELAAVQATLGIAHPTGYPLFTLAGYIFLHLPLPFTKIHSANMLAAIWCALSIMIFIKILHNMFLQISFFEKKKINKTKKKEKPEASAENKINNRLIIILSSIIAGLALAFSKTFWMQSTSVEVYSLQIFLFTLIIYFSLKAFYNQTTGTKKWLYVASILALGFSNHMTTLLILPGLAYLFFTKEKFNSKSLKKIGLMLLVFFPVIILFYLYLPIRASMNPAINWGNPVNFENFWRHFTGKQYQVWLFSSFSSAEKQLSYFISNFPAEFTVVGLILTIAGIFSTFKNHRRLFYFWTINFVFTVIYSINYEITDIDSYFLLAYISIAVFIAYGIYYLMRIFVSKGWNTKIIIPASFVVPLFILIMNFSKSDQSDVYTFEDYTKTILNSVEKKSIIFTYAWDYLVSPSYYYQFVENYRKDVAIIDKELLRRSWYYNQLKCDHPDITAKIQPEINGFLTAVRPFERGEQYNSEFIEKKYRAVMTDLIAKNIGSRNYHITLELFQNEMAQGEFQLPAGYSIVPYQFLFKVVKTSEYVPSPDYNFRIRFPKNGNKYTESIKRFVATMMAYRSLYELQYRKIDKARLIVEKIRNEFPEFRLPDQLSRL